MLSLVPPLPGGGYTHTRGASSSTRAPLKMWVLPRLRAPVFPPLSRGLADSVPPGFASSGPPPSYFSRKGGGPLVPRFPPPSVPPRESGPAFSLSLSRPHCCPRPPGGSLLAAPGSTPIFPPRVGANAPLSRPLYPGPRTLFSWGEFSPFRNVPAPFGKAESAICRPFQSPRPPLVFARGGHHLDHAAPPPRGPTPKLARVSGPRALVFSPLVRNHWASFLGGNLWGPYPLWARLACPPWASPEFGCGAPWRIFGGVAPGCPNCGPGPAFYSPLGPFGGTTLLSFPSYPRATTNWG